jgi:hypothetical protein
MIYAQFYHYDLSGNLVEACGDRSVVIIDARLKSRTIGELAAEECKKRGYIAWAIFKGESFTNSVRVSHIWHAHAQEPARDPAWLSAHGM